MCRYSTVPSKQTTGRKNEGRPFQRCIASRKPIRIECAVAQNVEPLLWPFVVESAGWCSTCRDVFNQSHVGTGLFVERRKASEREFKDKCNEPGKA
jgi:hypothetical protein